MKWTTKMGLSAMLGTLGYGIPTGANNQLEQKLPSYEERMAECSSPLEKVTIEEQTKKLNEMHNYGMKATDLPLLTRVVYMEAGNDRKAKTQEQLERGWEGVAQVILNRYLFDKNNGTHRFAKQETSLEAIARAPMQFHPVSFFPNIFKESTLEDDSGKARLSYGRINEKKAERIYDTLIKVLEQEREDITDGAVFFHGDYIDNGRTSGTTAFYLGKTRCKHKLTTQLGTHQFFATTCAIDPFGESSTKEEVFY